MYTQPLPVVRAYQKLIYAPTDEQKRLISEYRTADQAGTDLATIASTETTVPSQETDVATFDPGLTPETTEAYPLQGAEILSFRMLDLTGRVVNVVYPGQECQIEVCGRFLTANDRIYFGIHIRSISGTVITGQRHPENGKFLDRIVRAGENFCITYGFKMTLVPGVYFVGGGVWSLNEPNCLHRITDALMFRIMPTQDSYALGVVDTASIKPSLVFTRQEIRAVPE